MRGIWRMGAFAVVAVIVALGVDRWITAGLRRAKDTATGDLHQVMSGQINAQIIVSGSSRAMAHYDPFILQQETGRSVFNLGRNGSHIDMQLAVLKAYLRHNTKPELIIQNMDPHTFAPTTEVYDPAQYIPFLREDSLYEALVKIHPEAWKWKYIPLYGYAVEDMRLAWVEGAVNWFRHEVRARNMRGYSPKDKEWSGDFDRFKAQNPNGHKAEILPAGIRQFEDLIHTCKQAHAPLLLVFSPELFEMQAFTVNRDQLFRLFKEIAQREQIPFWDFSSSAVCKQRTYFVDSQHLNRRGASAFSTELGERLQHSGLLSVAPASTTAKP